MTFHVLRRNEQGLTLTELVITMAISGILLSAIVSAFITQRKAYALQEQITEMTLNVRAALDIMTREVRMAGYGAPTSRLADWIDWLRDENGVPIRLTSHVQITKGGTEPDTLSIVGCFDPPIANLQADINAGSNSIRVRYKNTTNKVNNTKKKIFYLGRHENGIVTASPRNRSRVNTLAIDTDPTKRGNQGITEAYRADNTPLELLKVITYAIEIDKKNYATPTPILKRDENSGGHAQPLADHIDDLRLTQDGNSLMMTLTGRTAKPDPNYTHPIKGDGYRRLTLSSRVKIRNSGL